MSLVIEDGSGVADAESYVSGADCLTYATNRGLTFTDDAAGEQALRRATTWLDNTYRTRFVGFRTHRRAQGLEWPRAAAYYYTPAPAGIPIAGVHGYGYGAYEYDPVAIDVVPIEIVNACCEAAVRELASPGSLSPDVTMGQIVRREQVGPLQTEYAVGVADARSQTPIVQIIDGLIGPLLSTSGQSPYSGKAVRG